MNTSSEGRSSLTARLELLATILLIVVAVLVGSVTVWDRINPPVTEAARQAPRPPATPPPPSDPVSIEGAQILGNKNAKVALIVFSEFECPYCAKSARDVLPEIDRHYLSTGKVLLVWRHFPLPIHKNARKAAEASECAGRQGKFWEFHDWAFQNQTQLDQANLHAAAKTLGLSPAAFRACLDGEATARVKADFDAGTEFTIAGTPTWFVGVMQPDGKVKVTDRLDGARNFAVFQKTIDKVIATAYASQ